MCEPVDEESAGSFLYHLLMQALRDSTSVRIFDTVIPRSVKVAECSQMGVSIYRHNRTGKVTAAYEDLIAFHGYQSFKPGEVTPDTAHEIGLKLAEEILQCFSILVVHIKREYVGDSLK